MEFSFLGFFVEPDFVATFLLAGHAMNLMQIQNLCYKGDQCKPLFALIYFIPYCFDLIAVT